MQKIEEDEKEALTDKRLEEEKADIVENTKKKKKKAKKKKDKRKKNEELDDEEKESEKDSKKKSSVNSEMFNIGTYSLIKMLGSGSFGEIHLAYDTSTRQLRAIKFELASQKNPQLKHEYNILEHINKSESGNFIDGVPKVYGYDRVENKCNFMIMDFLGPSLADLFQFRNKNFSLKTVCLLGIQMLSRIEFLHEKGFIHRDIKPENFVIGLNDKSSTVYVIDFGLAKRYKDKNTGQHIPYRENRHLIGTARYASLNAHLGIEQSRRDDIESIGYVIIYFLAGRLPWQSKNDKAKSPAKIMEKKLVTPPEILCKKQSKFLS
jgi:serine/threonine protein kinase